MTNNLKTLDFFYTNVIKRFTIWFIIIYDLLHYSKLLLAINTIKLTHFLLNAFNSNNLQQILLKLNIF